MQVNSLAGRIVPLVSLFLAPAVASPQDWPQFLGPTRNGVFAGAPLATTWPKEGPPVLWQKGIGSGWSGPVLASGKLILHHRLGDKETVDCLEARTGRTNWTQASATHYRDSFGFDDGPRATPCIAAGKVYTFGAEGLLQCLDFETGKSIWSVDTKKEFQAPNGYFGMACSPLLEGRAVLMNIGGRDGAGIVAFDRESGKVLWKATDEEASYSSPVSATVAGKRYTFFFNRAGLVALEPASGKIQFEYPWRPAIQASVNAAAPLVIGDLIFISTCYDRGALLLRFDEKKPEKIWSGDETLSNHYATSVHHNGFLYGIDGRADPGFQPPPSLRCVELKTGQVRWREESLGAGTVTLAGDRLLILTDKGQLVLADASPKKFSLLARAQILPTMVRAHPALADGLFYGRSKDKLVCADLRAAPKD
jgi:outer membrane protein assembly factor BamB